MRFLMTVFLSLSVALSLIFGFFAYAQQAVAKSGRTGPIDIYNNDYTFLKKDDIKDHPIYTHTSPNTPQSFDVQAKVDSGTLEKTLLRFHAEEAKQQLLAKQRAQQARSSRPSAYAQYLKDKAKMQKEVEQEIHADDALTGLFITDDDISLMNLDE